MTGSGRKKPVGKGARPAPYVFLFLLSFPFLLLSAPGVEALDPAADAPSLTARRLEYDAVRNAFVATGQAHLVGEGGTLDADRITYLRGSRAVEAEGNVLFRDGETVLSADRATVELETGLGDAVGDVSILFLEKNVHVHGTELEKTGRDRFRIHDCVVTTCDEETPDWSFRASTADFNMGRSISGNHVRFRVKKMPVFYSPWFWAPALVQKQSGFLFPQLGYSNRQGGYLGLKYYWMMAVNRDATVHLDVLSKRGLGTGLEFRYLERFGARGDFWIYHIADDRTQRNFVEVEFEHDQKFSRDLRGYVRLNFLSEKDYYKEFIPSQEDKLKRYLENVVHLSWQPRINRLYATGRLFQNLEGTADAIPITAEAGGRFFHHTLERLPVYFSVDGRLNRFARKTGPEGQRIHVHPILTGAVALPYFTLTPVAAWSGTWYDLRDWTKEKPVQEVRTLGATLATKVARDFGPVRHYVEPEVVYEYEGVRGDEVPVFDSVDIAAEKNAVSMVLTNRFYHDGVERFRFGLTEGFDFRADRRAWSNLAFDVYAQAVVSLTGSASYNVYTNDVENAQADIRYDWSRRGRSNHVAAGYRFDRVNVDTTTAEIGFWPLSSLSTFGRAWYDSTGGGLREFEVQLGYSSQCWGVNVQYFERPEENRILGNITLSGLGSLGTDQKLVP